MNRLAFIAAFIAAAAAVLLVLGEADGECPGARMQSDYGDTFAANCEGG